MNNFTFEINSQKPVIGEYVTISEMEQYAKRRNIELIYKNGIAQPKKSKAYCAFHGQRGDVFETFVQVGSYYQFIGEKFTNANIQPIDIGITAEDMISVKQLAATIDSKYIIEFSMDYKCDSTISKYADVFVSKDYDNHITHNDIDIRFHKNNPYSKEISLIQNMLSDVVWNSEHFAENWALGQKVDIKEAYRLTIISEYLTEKIKEYQSFNSKFFFR